MLIQMIESKHQARRSVVPSLSLCWTLHHTRPEVLQRGTGTRILTRCIGIPLSTKHSLAFSLQAVPVTGRSAMCIRLVSRRFGRTSNGWPHFSHFAMVFIASTDQVIHRSELFGGFFFVLMLAAALRATAAIERDVFSVIRKGA